MDSVLIRYHEIALKKGNRRYFIELLKRNLISAVKDLGIKEIRSLPARLLLTFKADYDTEVLIERIRSVFGVANFSMVERTPRDIETLRDRILESLDGSRFSSFRIDTQRGDKTFALKSPEINRQLGAAVKNQTGARVDLTNAELTVTVEILPRDAFFGFNKIAGPGGLPVGASGRVVALISGGIDSPVGAYRMMQRGCRLIFVHFHSTPYLDQTSQEKVRQLVARADPPPIPIAALPDPIRRDSAANRCRCRPTAAGHLISANDAANCRAGRASRKMPSPGYRRKSCSGGVTNLGEYGGDSTGSAAADSSAAGRNGQTGNHRSGAPHRHLRDLLDSRPGLLPAFRSETSGYQGAPR